MEAEVVHLIPVGVAGVEEVHLNQVGEVEVAEGQVVHIREEGVVVEEEVEHLIQVVVGEVEGAVGHLIQVAVEEVAVELVFHIQVAGAVVEEEGAEGVAHLNPEVGAGVEVS